MWYLIFLGIILYLIVAWMLFRVAAANDFFEEFTSYKVYSFPTTTFCFALLWIITIPLSIIGTLISWIAEEIECAGYAYREAAVQKRRQKNKEKKKEEETTND